MRYVTAFVILFVVCAALAIGLGKISKDAVRESEAAQFVEKGLQDLRITTLKGDKGDRGERGLSGVQGVQGLPGLPGIDGLNGVDGHNGRDGTNGLNGTCVGTSCVPVPPLPPAPVAAAPVVNVTRTITTTAARGSHVEITAPVSVTIDGRAH